LWLGEPLKIVASNRRRSLNIKKNESNLQDLLEIGLDIKVHS
jgi:hypothetical protein